MKANSRRRVLISSMAMLLVALVALSTATYAWFTSSTQATAKRLSVQTIKSSTLEVATNDQKYGTEVFYMADKAVTTLLPTSSSNGVNWYSATAAANNAHTAKDGFTQLQDTETYVYINELNIRNAGDADVTNVKVKFSIPEVGNGKYARVALVPIEAAGTTLTDEHDFAGNVYSVGGEAYDAVSGTALTDVVSIDPEDATGQVTVDVTTGAEKLAKAVKDSEGNITSCGTKHYKVLVWFEGQDTQCHDQFAGNTVPNIQFTVTADVASQV
ncbi:MAG: hypothetical protein IJ346_05680 [Clostridia bacterium]|nr:hypothetical protein [Clostridia bacterium]